MSNKPKKSSKTYSSGKGRASFPHIESPDVGRKLPDGRALSDGKYKVDLLLPKSNPQALDTIMAACRETIANMDPGSSPEKYHLPIKDGDSPKNKKADGTPKNAYALGHWVVSFKAKDKPKVVGPDLKPLTAGQAIYPGAEIEVGFAALAYPVSPLAQPEGKSISLYLNLVKWTGKGEQFGGTDPNAVFAAEQDAGDADVV